VSKCRANLNIHTSIAHFEMKKTIVFLNRRKINRYSMKIINSLIQSSHIMGNGNKVVYRFQEHMVRILFKEINVMVKINC